MRILLFILGSMSISYIMAVIAYWRTTRCFVKFDDLILTGSQFFIASAISGLILSFF